MSSPTLLRLAGTIFALLPIGHTQMATKILYPGLQPLGSSNPAAYSSKVSWNQANGYFIVSSLLCFKWASSGIEGWDVYIFSALLATHLTAGFVYAKKGIYPPTLAYWTSSLLMGIAAARGA